MEAHRSDICIALNYYTPYVSGLTNVARDVAEALAARGRKVTVVASRHDPALPAAELIKGVRVVRTPVALRIGKGVISPTFAPTVVAEAARARVLNLHAPMLEAGWIASQTDTPIVLTYQCDVNVTGILGQLQNRAIDASTRAAARRSKFVAVSSLDYIRTSRVADAVYEKAVEVPPTCHLRTNGRPTFRETLGFHVGFLGRIVEEKGLEYLVAAFRRFDSENARLLIAGDFERVAGGSLVERVRRAMAGDGRIRLLGFLPDEQVPDFYASLDAFALPSVNSFEAFGIVQVEAMMLGIPVVASNLPGVRQPVLRTGMGTTAEPRSVEGLHEALVSLAAARIDTRKGAAAARQLYSIDLVMDEFERLIDRAAA